ncbi:MAG: 2OG-Fe(II) oxygenase [Pegethrix bostrychoides GSE-TBD4-15B]|jgi:Rps23 Pro-64 3,4-dihydroxylase Tpa1-like proline 4-hydroxylase|uniref:2OG-Fe(II) oxygenase n=1 Tax=Pegethrix bostrychoides GSE-TBD4-15B TaxID=2839662 RepID=A0A951PAX7_9CYAN|nr:2OG-Fe(II) oxygenase [Pegethrix bostrychoides GSE-TBD4-15B]
MKRKGFAPQQKERADLTSVQRREAQGEEQAERSAEQSEVAVTILLAGGQQYSVVVAPNDALLQDLYQTMMAESGSIQKLFQISLNQGQAMLTFHSSQLVGVITEPPLLIEQNPQHLKQDPKNLNGSIPPVSPLAATSPLVSEYWQLDNFLSAEEHRGLLNYVKQHELEFVPTSTFTGVENYRESVVLYSFPEYAALISKRIHAILPDLIRKFELPPFVISQIEAQLTAHNDGQFYKIHNDNGSEDTATRELTYVYYFYQEPKPFTGGELRIYDSQIQNNYYVQADSSKTVEPRNNSIVFFLSRYMHEVLPIRCPSGRFADSRFTINGWIRR